MSEYRERSLLWLMKETLNFDSIPPAADYLNYGKALLICCKGDGDLADKERGWVIGYFSAFGCPDDVLDELSSFDGEGSLADVVNSSPQMQMTSKAAIYDAVRACDADGELAKGEIDVIKNIAGMINVSERDVDDIISIYHAEAALKTTRLQITYPDGSPF